MPHEVKHIFELLLKYYWNQVSDPFVFVLAGLVWSETKTKQGYGEWAVRAGQFISLA